MTDIKDLVDALQSVAPDPAVKLRQGVIQSVQTSSVTLTIGGSATAVSGVKYLSSYSPTVGDTVWLATDGRDWLVIGKLGPGSGGGGSIVEALPAGSIIEWGGATAPANWLIADGSAVSRTTYASLFAAIGTTFGAGDGSTTFNLPDMRGRVPVGKNGGTFGTLGATGGAETVALTLAQMPGHSHAVTITDPGHTHSNTLTNATVASDGHTHGSGSLMANIWVGYWRTTSGNSWTATNSGGVTAPGGSTTSTTSGAAINGSTAGNSGSVTVGITNASKTTGITASTDTQGSGSAHSNLQPYQVVNYIIKYSNGDTAGDSQLTQRVSALEGAPSLHLDRTTTQSLPDTTYTAITWNSESVDTAGMFTSGTDITVQKAGFYSITVSISWPNSTAGSRTARILKNGTAINLDKISPFNGPHWSNLSWIDTFAVGDVITVDALQNTGAALSINSATISAAWMHN